MREAGTNSSVRLSRDVVANIDYIGEARVFIAWSEETKNTADLIFNRLEEEELSAWLSDQIAWGAPFRKKIREAILSADLVIAVFPEEPSRWQIAEAGLAYFEQKLLPVVIDTGRRTTPTKKANHSRLRLPCALSKIFFRSRTVAVNLGKHTYESKEHDPLVNRLKLHLLFLFDTYSKPQTETSLSGTDTRIIALTICISAAMK
ncbi:MAG: toll/interleukin-1 receptor domain-containing protein [Granulosicoccus sp.]